MLVMIVRFLKGWFRPLRQSAFVYRGHGEIEDILQNTLCAHRNISITGLHSDLLGCIDALQKERPNFLFFELDYENYKDLVGYVSEQFPKIRLIAVSIRPRSRERILRMFCAGVVGYIHVLSTTEDILCVFDHACAGDSELSSAGDKLHPLLQEVEDADLLPILEAMRERASDAEIAAGKYRRI